MSIIIQETYPGTPLRFGDNNIHVLNMKMALNLISLNFPAIPKVTPLDFMFNESLQVAVTEFQRIFNLPATGIVDKATWYEIRKIYGAVKNFIEITNQGEIVSDLPRDILFEVIDGQVIPRIQLVQYFLNVLSAYYDSILPVDINGIYDLNTRDSIINFQKTMGLPATGLLDQETWEAMYRSVLGIIRVLPPTAVALPAFIFPRIITEEGSSGPEVFIIQELLSYISTVVSAIPNVDSDGIFGPETKNAVIAFQNLYGIEADGIVDEETWNKIVSVYRERRFGQVNNSSQLSETNAYF